MLIDTNTHAEVAPAWLNYKQAEAYSSLSRTTLWQLINADEIKAARISINGSKRPAVRIERASLQGYMEKAVG